MKELKLILLSVTLFMGTSLVGQTTETIIAHGTYIPSQRITISSPSKPDVVTNGDGTQTIKIIDSKGWSNGNSIPNGTSIVTIVGGPIFYSGGPQAQLTCGHAAGVCAEIANTSYLQYVDPW